MVATVPAVQQLEVNELLSSIPEQIILNQVATCAHQFLDEAMKFRVGAVSAIKVYRHQLQRSTSQDQTFGALQFFITTLSNVYGISAPMLCVTNGQCCYHERSNTLYVDERQTVLIILREMCFLIYGNGDMNYCFKWAINLYRKGFQAELQALLTNPQPWGGRNELRQV